MWVDLLRRALGPAALLAPLIGLPAPGAPGAGADSVSTASTPSVPPGGAATPAAAPDRAERVASLIATLESGDARTRLSAQRELAALLTLDDLGTLAAALERASAEGRRRLLEAIVGRGRGLALAVGLAGEERFAVREVGREAIAALYTGWAGPAERFSPRQVEAFLAEAAPPDRLLVARLSDDSLAEGLDLLARTGGLPLRLVVDPSLDPSLDALGRTGRGAGRAEMTGDAFELLLRLLVRGRLTFEGWALGDPQGVPLRLSPRAWLRVHRPGEESATGGAELVTRWLLEVTQERAGELQRVRAEAAARALGALGWPAALDWLAERQRRGDALALEGLVTAAERGRVATVLGEARLQNELLARLRAAVRTAAEGADEAEAGLAALEAGRLARALQAVGPLGAGGRETAGPTLEAFATASAAERPYLCAALEGQVRSDRASLDVVRRWVADADVEPAARYAGCLVLAGAGARHDGVAELDALFPWVLAGGRRDEFLDLAVKLELDPPAAWREPGNLSAAWPFSYRFTLLTWLLERDDEERAAAHLRALIDAERPGGRYASAVTEGLRSLRLRRGVSTTRRLLARAAEGLSAERRGRLELLAGLAEEAELERRDAELAQGSGPLGRDVWLEAAALAGLPRWSLWRERLLRPLFDAGPDDRALAVRALSVAERALAERRLDDEREALVTEVFERTSGEPVWERLGLDPDAWPRRPDSVGPTELDHLDRPVR